ncbi:MAG: VanZ family protein [Kiritimatiellae bacterium]|nr:VanZ family protein [Kiritimatiellia bacterium]
MVFRPPKEDEATSWLWVALWILCIYITVPLARTIQGWVADHADPMLFFWVVIAWVVVGGLVAVRNLIRLEVHPTPAAWCVLAAVAASYAWFSWQLRENPEEAFHFIQYGVLSLLVFRALTHRFRDPSIFVIAALFTTLFGMLDEGFQWVVPGRFFDFRDMGINAGAGVLMQVALAFGVRPAYIHQTLIPRAWQIACRCAIAVLILLLGYLSNTARNKVFLSNYIQGLPAIDEVMVEYGYRIDRPDLGLTFYSRLPFEEVVEQDRTRWEEVVPDLNVHWKEDQYIPYLKKYPSFQDPFLHELRIHQFRRDRYRFYAFSAPHLSDERRDNATVSVREDQIMRLLYPNIYAHALLGWPDQELEHMTSLADLSEPYVSKVSSGIITAFRPWSLRWVIIGLMVVVIVTERILSTQAQKRQDTVGNHGSLSKSFPHENLPHC